MPDDDAPNPIAAAAAAARAAEPGLGWSQLWQLPVLGVGLLMLGLGVYLAKPVVVPTDYGARLDAAERYLDAENAAEARATLNEVAELGVTGQDRPTRGRYRQYLGDHDVLEYERIYPVPVETPQSTAALNRIDEHYAAARDLGRTLDDDARVRWSTTLVRLGRAEDALAVIADMGGGGADARYATLRGLIDRHRARLGAKAHAVAAGGASASEDADAGASADAAALARLTARFEDALRTDPDAPRRRRQQRWLVGLKAQALLDARDPYRAIDYLNRETQRLRAGGAEDDPGLLVKLADAYRQAAEYEQAGRLYAAAQRALDTTDPRNADVLLGQAELELATGGEGYDDRARVLFTRAADEHPQHERYLEALIGRAHTEAMQRRVGDAVEHFGRAVDLLAETTPVWDERRRVATERISGHVDLSIDLGNYDDALDYLTLMRPLYGASDPAAAGPGAAAPALPPRLLRQFADIHERRADQHLERAEELNPRVWAGPGEPPVEARRTAFQQAVYHYTQAAEFFRRHADAVTVIDDAAFGESLWRAAHSYDRAEAWDDAIRGYAEYVEGRPGDADGRQLEARHRLGLAYLADRQFGAAADVLERLTDENPGSNWSYASQVPLAHALRETGREDKALRTLLNVVDGHPGITPDSDVYRDALIELGRLYYDRAADDPAYFASAIERLDVAVQRFGRTDRGPELRYLLADARRRSAAELTADGEATASERERAALQTEAQARLKQAEAGFDQVIVELEARPDGGRTQAEELQMRNAYFFKGDCAYDRGDHALAIDRYREAAQRFREHPAALIAQVQIVNAHCELGQYREAHVANQNALYRLSQLPDEAFDRPDMPMTRQHWEDWLRWSNELKLLDREGGADEVAAAGGR